MRFGALLALFLAAGCMSDGRTPTQSADPPAESDAQAILRRFAAEANPIERVRIAEALSTAAAQGDRAQRENIVLAMRQHAASADPLLADAAKTFFFDPKDSPYDLPPPEDPTTPPSDVWVAWISVQYNPEVVKDLYRLQDKTIPARERIKILSRDDRDRFGQAFLPAFRKIAMDESEPAELRAAIVEYKINELIALDPSMLQLATDKSSIVRRAFASAVYPYEARKRRWLQRLTLDADESVRALATKQMKSWEWYRHDSGEYDALPRESGPFSRELCGIKLGEAGNLAIWDQEQQLFFIQTSECDGGCRCLTLTSEFSIASQFPIRLYLVEWKVNAKPTDRGISLGMTREQVRSVFGYPNEKELIEVADRYIEAESYSKVYKHSTDPDFEVSFRATYYYYEGKLCGITLSRSAC